MNRRLFYTLGIVLIVSVNNMSCGKDSDPAPVLTINMPTEQQKFNNGEVVRILGNVTDNSLHELTIRIKDNGLGANLYSQTIDIHNLTQYTIDDSWHSNVTATTTATLTVEVVDHGGNRVEKQVVIIIRV